MTGKKRKRYASESGKCPYIKRTPRGTDCLNCGRSICIYDEKKYEGTTKRGVIVLNKVILMGRLAKDVDLRSTQSGKSVARMTIAVDRPYSSNRQAGQPSADFLNLIAWEKKADFAEKYLHKGSKILVEGRIETRSYEAQDGSKRYVTEIKVSDIEFAESKNSGGGFSQQYEQAVDNNESIQGSMFGNPQKIDDSDIPF